MTAVTFSQILLLRGVAGKDDVLSILPESRRSEVEAVLKDLESLSESELQLSLERHREQELRQQSPALSDLGILPYELSPKLREWLSRPFAGRKT